MTRDEAYLMREMAERCCTTSYRDRHFQAIMLRSARNEYERIAIRRMIMNARQRWLTWVTIQQRKWQANISRRPQRTRNHDSWAIRESYVRGGSYTMYLPTKGAPQRGTVRRSV